MENLLAQLCRITYNINIGKISKKPKINMDNIPVEHKFALSYDGREVTSQMLQALKEYHSEEVAEFGEDVENNFDKWLNNQSQMDIDYILEKYSYED